jgi:sugar phosphate isomerase/epimerase
MNFSIVLSTQPSSFSALAYKGNLAENIAKIKALGFDGVELAVRDPGQLDFDFLASILEEHNLPVSAIGTGQAYVEEHLSLTDPKEEIRERAVQRIKSHALLAKQLQALVIIGLIRGKKDPNLGRETAETYLVESLRECASSRPDVRFAIEPINRYETDLLNDVRGSLQFLERIGKDNVGLLLDTFHMNIEEQSITESIRLARNSLFHFHVADSNRWYPGAGHIDFKAIFNTLAEIRYAGFVSAEILPLPDPDTAAKETIRAMRGLSIGT